MCKIYERYKELAVWERIAAFIVLSGLIVGGVYMIIDGVSTLDSVEEFYDIATVETCDILSVTSTNCRYCCKHDDDGDCKDECDGFAYDYTAIAYDKCGNQTLFSEAEGCVDPNDAYKADTERTCSVLGCDEERFSFNTPEKIKNAGTTLIVIFSLCQLLFLPAAIYFTAKSLAQCHKS